MPLKSLKHPHYTYMTNAGHGSQKRDWSGDERDGMNETILPTDFQSAGQIVDDELNERLVNHLPRGVRLHALLDACHSGTGLDLPYIVALDMRTNQMNWKSEGRTRSAPTVYSPTVVVNRS
jgi:hypothetical protein